MKGNFQHPSPVSRVRVLFACSSFATLVLATIAEDIIVQKQQIIVEVDNVDAEIQIIQNLVEIAF